jgi:DNA gyrase/topoisomerase IV subunit A
VDERPTNQQVEPPIFFQTVEEFCRRPGFELTLECKPDDLDRIVGKYERPRDNLVQCGLNRCNQWHQYGYVICTKKGLETNCGQDCGRREFNVNFDEVEAAYKKAEDAEARRKLIEAVLSNKAELVTLARVTLEEVSAASSDVAAIVNELGKDAALGRALTLCLRNGGRVQVARKDSHALNSAMGASSGQADLETIATISGGEAVALYARQAGSIADHVIKPLTNLNEDMLRLLDEKDLEKQTKQIAELRRTLQESQAFLASAKVFCTEENLTRFAALKQTMPRSAQTSRVNRIIARLPTLLTKSASESSDSSP